jgi:putative tryptophan/tyrosine transport system substrate-binding protein
MRRREFITLLGGTAAAWPLAAPAQRAGKVHRISVVNIITANDPEASPRVTAFELELRKLGWATERELRIDYYWDASDVARRGVVANQVAESRPDVIVAATTQLVQALRDTARGVPIVFVQVIDPVGTGLVANLARPGANLTGFTNFEFAMVSKWLELLKEIVPNLRNVVQLFNPATVPGPALAFFVQTLEAAAPAFAVTPTTAFVKNADEIEGVLSALARTPNTGLMLSPDVFTTRHRDLIIPLVAAYRLPAIYPYRYFATAGGLLSYGMNTIDVFRQAASYVDRILKGAKPADLPVQQPTKFELVINLKTAKALGLDVPWFLQQRADEVIE